jgi:hypothetical protein
MTEQDAAQALKRAWSRSGSRKAAEVGLATGKVNPKTFSFRWANVPGYVYYPYNGKKVERIQ